MSTTGELASTGGARSPGPPPPSRVPGNRWNAIDVQDVGALDARETVSVVVSGPDPDRRLPLTLAALAGQTYPSALTDVLVASDAARTEAELGEAAGDLTVALVPPEAGSSAFGSAVTAAKGNVVVVVPAGSIPSRELVEAHARWHHSVADAVSVGVSHAVDAGSLRADEVLRLQGRGSLDALLEPRWVRARWDEEAVEAYLERTRDLTERRPDLFRLAGRGSMGVRGATLREVGGADGAWAGSDEAMSRLDLAYRLECHGCVFAPERRAVTFEHYPYEGPALQGAVEDLLDEGGTPQAAVDPRVADLLPAAGFRSRDSSRMHTRPAMVVELAAGEEGAEETVETVDAILRGRFQDVELHLAIDEDHPERATIEEACAPDPRIVIGRAPTEASSHAAVRVSLPAVAVPDERTFEDIHELMTKEGMGALHVTVPGEVPRNAMVEAVATGPLARARRVASADGEEPEVVLGRLFGERWVSGVEVSIRRRGAPEPQVTEHGPLARATDIDHERKQHLRHSSRAAVNQARADRYAERAERERLKARAERARAERIEARIARTQSSRAYSALRPLRRLGGIARDRLRR